MMLAEETEISPSTDKMSVPDFISKTSQVPDGFFLNKFQKREPPKLRFTSNVPVDMRGTNYFKD